MCFKRENASVQSKLVYVWGDKKNRFDVLRECDDNKKFIGWETNRMRFFHSWFHCWCCCSCCVCLCTWEVLHYYMCWEMKESERDRTPRLISQLIFPRHKTVAYHMKYDCLRMPLQQNNIFLSPNLPFLHFFVWQEIKYYMMHEKRGHDALFVVSAIPSYLLLSSITIPWIYLTFSCKSWREVRKMT